MTRFRLSEKIVVVDDDPSVFQSLRLISREYQFLCFLKANDALEFFKKPNTINLALIDFQMPEMNGLTLIKNIQNINSHIALILMTGYSSQNIVIKSIQNHVNDYLEKPFQVEEVREKIQYWLTEKIFRQQKPSDKKDLVHRIQKFIENNIHDVSLRELSKNLYLSQSYITRILKQVCSTNFRKFKLQVKLRQAQTLLKDTNMTIEKIAFKLGYENPFSFMRTFKTKVGLTPTAYRNQKK